MLFIEESLHTLKVVEYSGNTALTVSVLLVVYFVFAAMGHICQFCDKEYTDGSNLRRHMKTHTQPELKCEHCEKCFSRSDYLNNHLLSIHGVTKEKEVKDFKCSHPDCEKSYGLRLVVRSLNIITVLLLCLQIHPNDFRFVYRKNLLQHLRTSHPEDKENQESGQRCGVKDMKKCLICSSSYVSMKGLNKHMREKHAGSSIPALGTNAKDSKMACPVCDNVSLHYVSLTEHLRISHDFDEDVENYEFSSMEEFHVWKGCAEVNTFSSYVNRRGVRDVVNGKKHYFECHRSGFFKSRSLDMRIRHKETNKIDAVCPARMLVTEISDSVQVELPVQVEWHKSHFGHECDINFLRLSQSERDHVAKKLKKGVTFDTILDEVRDSVEAKD